VALQAELTRRKVALGMVWVPKQGLTLGHAAGYAAGLVFAENRKPFSATTSILKEVLGFLRHKVARERGGRSLANFSRLLEAKVETGSCRAGSSISTLASLEDASLL